jgi:energy-coupling factor transport system ATP-binding protein
VEQPPAFSFKGVVYSYKGASSPALSGVDLEVMPGEWVVLLGANGSGKSTLAKICNALLLPAQGSCCVFGMDVSDPEKVPLVRQRVALVFQNPEDQIVASIVEEDVAFGPENLCLPQTEIRRRVNAALELTGLADMKRRGSYTLSGGQKQRLALAGALALEPKALVLDESTSMLDPEGRDSFLERIAELNRHGMTMIQITHRMDETVFASRVVVLSSGCVAWDGIAADFWDGAYLYFDFEEPPELALYRELRSRGLVPPGTRPRVDDLLESLWL